MQGVTAMKVPDKYEPRTPNEFGTFDAAMTRILSVPSSEMQQRIEEHKKKKARKKLAKISARGPSRDSGNAA